MPAQSAAITLNLVEEKPAAPLHPFGLPPREPAPPAAEPEEIPVTTSSSRPKLPAVFPVYAFI